MKELQWDHLGSLMGDLRDLRDSRDTETAV
jgi:hypothetical protein